jgi:hypothetical protein
MLREARQMGWDELQFGAPNDDGTFILEAAPGN